MRVGEILRDEMLVGLRAGAEGRCARVRARRRKSPALPRARSRARSTTTTVRSRARTAAGSAGAADAPREVSQARARARVRGHGRCRQGRRDQSHHARAGRAPVPGRAGFGADARKSARIRTCGASGATCRSAGTSRSSTAPGTAACWSSACAASPRPPDWRRAYDEICEFERQLTEHGLIVAKFWLQVSKAEQLRRFKARDEDPLKRFKVDPEDWTNRTFYDAYQAAAAEMVQRTDTPAGALDVVPADDKKSARLHVLQVVCETIEAALGA